MPIESGNAKTFGTLTLAAVETQVTLGRSFLIDMSATDFKRELADGKGGTVDIETSLITREPALLHTKADRAAGNEFIYKPLAQTVKSIRLEDYAYDGREINYNENTFLNFSVESGLAPAMGGNVALKINEIVNNKVNEVIGADTTAATVLTGTDEEKANALIKLIIGLRAELNKRGPSAAPDRTLAISSDLAAILLVSPQFRDVSQAGTSDALVEATLGRKLGFNIVEESGLNDGSLIGYSKNAFGLVLRTKAPSLNAKESTIVDKNGFVLNVTIDRDGRKQTDLITVGTFVGFDIVDPLKAVVAKVTV